MLRLLTHWRVSEGWFPNTLLHKKLFYKSIEAKILPNFKNILRTIAKLRFKKNIIFWVEICRHC